MDWIQGGRMDMDFSHGLVKRGALLGGLLIGGMGLAYGAPPVNLALNKPCKASSTEGTNIPSKAFDGVDNTGPARGQGNRWASSYDKKINPNVDSAWLYVDLGTKTGFDSIALKWEHSGAKNYDVQYWTSETDTPAVNDDPRWKTIYNDTALYYQNVPVDACLRFTRVPKTEARYVRVRCYKRLFNFGFSIFEFEIYNTGAPVSVLPEIGNGGFNILRTREHIVFQWERPALVVARLFSPTGKGIGTIRSAANATELTWAFIDGQGHKVGNGIYVLRVTLAGRAFSQKVSVTD